MKLIRTFGVALAALFCSLLLTGGVDARAGLQYAPVNSWNNSGGYVTSAVTVKSSVVQVYDWDIENTSPSTTYYAEFFNATSGNVTLGTTAPLLCVTIPPGPGARVKATPFGFMFNVALSVAVVTAPYGATPAPSSTVIVNLGIVQ